MSKHLCISGAAMGADQRWGMEAEKHDHAVRHYSFPDGPGRGRLSTVVLNYEQLAQADAALHCANQVLGRKVPKIDDYAGRLLRRNWWQIKDTERLYAVTYLAPNGLPWGGTAWAVQMYLDRCADEGLISEMYLFDQKLMAWFKWEAGEGFLLMAEAPPVPHGRYTGIGSRELDPSGVAAIVKVYG